MMSLARRSRPWHVALALLAILSLVAADPRTLAEDTGAVPRPARSKSKAPSGQLAKQDAKGKGAAADEHPFPKHLQAPSLDGGIEWINTAGPIDLKQLRGRFVLLDFWTYCCINCMH